MKHDIWLVLVSIIILIVTVNVVRIDTELGRLTALVVRHVEQQNVLNAQYVDALDSVSRMMDMVTTNMVNAVNSNK